LDAIAPETSAADRRPSVIRLTPALAPALPDGPAEALLLPLCFIFARHLRFDAADPLWPDRDRLLVDAGLAPLSESLANLLGLPERIFLAPGPAFGLGAGQALAERLLAARFGRSLVDHRSWVVAAAEDLPTGAVQEAAMLAGAWRLSRLTALTGVAAADAPGLAGFTAAGWSVRRVDAGAPADVAAAISAAQRSQRPTLIACIHTGQQKLGGPANAQASIDGTEAWRTAGRRSAGVRRAWLKRLARHGSRQDFENAAAGRLPHGWYNAFFEAAPLLPPGQAAISTSWTLRRAIVRLAASVPEVTRLPADAYAKASCAVFEPLSGRDAEGGLAQGPCQGLSAATAGLALHGGVVPALKHTLAQSDGVAAGLRAAAISGLRTLTLLIEPDSACPSGGRYASLRAIRNLSVFRPADASEALECADLALRRTTGPTVLLASDAPAPLLADRPSRTRCAKGGYVLAEAAAPRIATLIASGPELHLALAARTLLASAGAPVAVVSLPCWDVFARQEHAWQEAVLGDAPRIGLETGSGFGWERWLGHDGLFIALDLLEGLAWNAARPHASLDRLVRLILRHLGLPQLS
jgi:transketolase